MKKQTAPKTVMLRIRVTEELKDRLERDAAKRGISVSELIRRKVVRKPYVRRKGGEGSLRRDRTGGDATGSA